MLCLFGILFVFICLGLLLKLELICCIFMMLLVIVSNPLVIDY